MNAHQYVPLPDSTLPPKSGARRLRDADPDKTIQVTLSLRAPAWPNADAMPEKTLTREQFAAKYGAKQSDADEVAKSLEKFRIHVDDVSLRAHSMRVSGTVSAMQQAFQTHLSIYRAADQGDFRGREGTLQVPTEL